MSPLKEACYQNRMDPTWKNWCKNVKQLMRGESVSNFTSPQVYCDAMVSSDRRTRVSRETAARNLCASFGLTYNGEKYLG